MDAIVGASRSLNQQRAQQRVWPSSWSRLFDGAWYKGRRRFFSGFNSSEKPSLEGETRLSECTLQSETRTVDVEDVENNECRSISFAKNRSDSLFARRSTLLEAGIQTLGSITKEGKKSVGLLYDEAQKRFRFLDTQVDSTMSFSTRAGIRFQRWLMYKDIFTGRIQEHQKGEAIHPMSPLRTGWDVLMLILILVLCVVAPVRIGFDINQTLLLDVFDTMCDALLGVDIVLNFFTGFIEKNETHLEIRKVAKQYLKFWFWADVISTIPVNPMMKLGLLPNNRFIMILKLLRIVRLFRMLKVARLMNRIKWWVRIRFSVRSITKFLLIILMVAHWNTCLWCLMARWGDTEETWAGFVGVDIYSMPWPKLYLICFYWAITTMTTIGYGDIQPVTDNEKVLTLLVMCTGSCCYAYGITQIVTIVSNLNMADVFYHAQVDNLHEYIERRGLPKTLSHRILEFYDFKRHHSGVFFNEREILRDLPHSLRAEVVMHISEDIAKRLSKIPLFTGIDCNFMNNIMVRMKYEPYPPGETVVMEGEVGSRMYFINKGMLQVSVKGTMVATLRSGNFFGEVALYHNRGRRTATVDTLTYCEICSLQRKDVEAAFGPYPGIMHLIRNRAKDLWSKHQSENTVKLEVAKSIREKPPRQSIVNFGVLKESPPTLKTEDKQDTSSDKSHGTDSDKEVPEAEAAEEACPTQDAQEASTNEIESAQRSGDGPTERTRLPSVQFSEGRLANKKQQDRITRKFQRRLEDIDAKMDYIMETLSSQR